MSVLIKYVVCTLLFIPLVAVSQSCQYKPEVLSVLQSSALLLKLDMQFNRLIFDTIDDDQIKCDWVNEINEYVAHHDSKEDLYDFKQRCTQQKSTINFYIQAFNKYLEKKCSDTNCEELLEEFNKIEYLQAIGNSIYYQEPASQYSIVSLDSNPKINKIHIHKMAHDNACGEFDIATLFIGNFPEDKAKEINVILEKNIPEEIKNAKYQPLSVNEILDNLYEENYLVYNLAEIPEWLTPKIFTYSQYLYVFTGGAHGLSSTRYINVDLEKNKVLTLTDVFKLDNKQKLLEVLKKAFMQDNKILTPKEFSEFGFGLNEENIPEDRKEWSLSDGFYLPSNFLLTKEGIQFIYQLYEITPYVAGMPSFHVKWEEIEPYLLFDLHY